MRRGLTTSNIEDLTRSVYEGLLNSVVKMSNYGLDEGQTQPDEEFPAPRSFRAFRPSATRSIDHGLAEVSQTLIRWQETQEAGGGSEESDGDDGKEENHAGPVAGQTTIGAIQTTHESELAGSSSNPCGGRSMNSIGKERDHRGTVLDKSDRTGARESDSRTLNVGGQEAQIHPRTPGPESLRNPEKRFLDTAYASAPESSVQAEQRTFVQGLPLPITLRAEDVNGEIGSGVKENREATLNTEQPANLNRLTAAGPSSQATTFWSQNTQLDGSIISSLMPSQGSSGSSSNSNTQAAVRPLVNPHQQRTSTFTTITENERRNEVILPRWQPDSEVHKCPICRTPFSFFLRKHHCRKCGRVVCNSCSPHRITIPYQYIVQPPAGLEELEHNRTCSQNISQNSVHDSDIGGGMKVRLCNPCVPDPNTSPPVPIAPLDRPLPPLPTSRRRSPPPQAPPRTRIRTSELCPVCGDRLPPSTTAIENHIDRCITRRLNEVDFSTPMPRPQASRSPENAPGSVSLPSSSRTASHSSRSRHTSDAASLGNPLVPESSPSSSSTGAAPSRPFLSSRMICFAATHIDTIGEDSECIICMEDFEKGVDMARLECLCKYHKKCIDGWFFKHPGRCPVHGQDNY